MNSVLDFLDNSAERYPDHPAYEDQQTICSFQEARSRARSIGTALAARLKETRQPAAVYLEKSVNAILSFFGTVYSGNFYCPIDTEMPVERIQLIMKILSPRLVITDLSHREKALEFSDADQIVLLEDLVKVSPDDRMLREIRSASTELDPLYVLFTSGSTGVPKGVLLNHRVVINYMEWLSEKFDFRHTDVFGNQAPFYFDISIHDIYGAAFFGARMVIIPRILFSFPARLIEYMNEKKISTFLWVPSAMGIISKLKAFRAGRPQFLRHAMFAGEVLPRRQLDYWTANLPEVVYANLYGPTETYVCTAYVMNGSEPEGTPLPIGEPVSNTQALILDEAGKPVAKGETGELCIRGSCLAMGYYNNPEKTAASFVQNPLTSAYPDRIYHTGDLVYEDTAGQLIYVSRKDFQIKHMGYRIELGEIENAANRLDGIEDCACTYDSGRKRILLFHEGREYDANQLLADLSKLIPEYMLPGRIIHMDHLPRNANGKIDRKALAETT